MTTADEFPLIVALHWGGQDDVPIMTEVAGDPGAVTIEALRAALSAAGPITPPAAGFLAVPASGSESGGQAWLYESDGPGSARQVCGDRQSVCVCTHHGLNHDGPHECACGGSWNRGPNGEFEIVAFPRGPGDEPPTLIPPSTDGVRTEPCEHCGWSGVWHAEGCPNKPDEDEGENL